MNPRLTKKARASTTLELNQGVEVMSVCVEYVEGGILFTGHYLSWDAGEEAIRAAALAVAPLVLCQAGTIERLLRFELSHGRKAG